MFTNFPPATGPTGNDWDLWEEMDQSDAKECWVATGELGAFLDAQQALEGAGYRIRSVEMVKTHAVWTFDIDQEKTPPCGRERYVCDLLHTVLAGTGLRYHPEDLMVQPLPRNRLVFSIAWHIPAREPRRSRAWEREQRRLQKLLEKVR